MRLILFFLLCTLSIGAVAEPIPPHLQQWSFSDYFSYYRSVANYVTAGTASASLPINGSFSVMQDTLAVEYDAIRNLRFDANTAYAYSTASNNVTTFTGSGFTEFSAGAQYWFKNSAGAVVPSLHFGYPFYRVDVNSPPAANALISNAAAWTEGGLWGIFYFYPWAAYAYAGFRYQDGGQAGLLPLDLGVSYRFPEARVRLGIRGETTVMNDTYTNNPGLRLNTPNVVDAGSLKYFSLNPTVFEAYGEFDYIFTREWEAGAGAAQSFYGNNAAQGYTVLAMVRFRIPGARPAAAPVRGGPDFQEQEDRYNQRLFEESNPAHPPPQRPPKKGKNIDKALKDTEKTLERPPRQTNPEDGDEDQ